MKQDASGTGRIHSINGSVVKDVAKSVIREATLQEGFGLTHDAHGGRSSRHVSLLAIEHIATQTACPKARARSGSFGPGDFSENITTEGLDVSSLDIGTRCSLGAGAVLEITKRGRACHAYCDYYQQGGDCSIVREALFATVVKGGTIAIGDAITVLGDH